MFAYNGVAKYLNFFYILHLVGFREVLRHSLERVRIFNKIRKRMELKSSKLRRRDWWTSWKIHELELDSWKESIKHSTERK